MRFSDPASVMKNRGLKIGTQYLAGNSIVSLSLDGELDARTFGALENAIRAILDSGCYKLTIDLSQVAYISSAGVGVLIGAAAETRDHGGNVILINPAPSVQEIFNNLNLESLVTAVKNLDAALASFNAQAKST